MKDWKPKLKLRLPAMVLLVLTVVFWHFYDRYEPAGPVLLRSPSLADGTRMHGDCVESDGRYILNVVRGGPVARVNFPISGGAAYTYLRVQGRIKADGVVAGTYPWRCARLLLVQYDGSNKWISGRHGLIQETGTTDWKACEDVFEVDEQAARVDLSIQQLGPEGVAQFDQLSVEPVELRLSYLWWWVVFVAAWLAMAVLYYRRCRLESRRLKRLILLNAAIIVIGTMMPGEWIEGSADYAREEIAKLAQSTGLHTSAEKAPQKPAAPAKVEHLKFDQLKHWVGNVHGIGHFVLFAALCFLVYLSAALEGQHRSYFIKVAFDILLFAAITESLQHLTNDRIPGFSDWLIDVLGMLTAFLLFLAVLWFKPVVMHAANRPSRI